MSSTSLTRRTFVKTAAVAGLAAPYAVVNRVRAQSANETLNVAFVAVGGIAGSHTGGAEAAGCTCTCFCDVDTRRWGNAANRWPEAIGYTDYREMFDKHHKEIDAVMIGTPDHHHYPATMIAMSLGKHCYTQKPLTHTPWESRQLYLAARKYKVATQMGNQGHAGDGIRVIYEWIKSGVLGEISEVHTWTNRPIWPQGMGRPEGEDAVPPELNWDAWLGAAPERPFKEGAYHPFVWRGWQDFGTGALGDMACHTMDSMFFSLEPGYPTAIEPVAMMHMNSESFPSATAVKWEFPRRGSRPAFVAYWYDGNLRPPKPAQLGFNEDMPGTGNLYIGSKGVLIVDGDYGNAPRVILNDGSTPEQPPQLLERSPGHMTEWFMACRGEKSIVYPGSNFLYSAPLTETVLLGNVALRVNQRLEWDGEKFEVTNLPEANQYVSKAYRDGWKYTL